MRAAFVTVAVALSLTACTPLQVKATPWQIQATRATGLGKTGELNIQDAKGNTWMALVNEGAYHCELSGIQVTCEYLPICSNDSRSDLRNGEYHR